MSHKGKFDHWGYRNTSNFGYHDFLQSHLWPVKTIASHLPMVKLC